MRKKNRWIWAVAILLAIVGTVIITGQNEPGNNPIPPGPQITPETLKTQSIKVTAPARVVVKKEGIPPRQRLGKAFEISPVTRFPPASCSTKAPFRPKS